MNMYLKRILKLFNDCVNKYSEKVAIKSEENAYTYEQIDKLSNVVCNNIYKLKSESKIYAICSEKTPNFIITILGLWKAQCAYIPIDTSLPIERIKYIIENSKINNLITDKNNVGKFNDIIDTIDMNTLFINNDRCYASKTNNDLAYVIYTSGSTGNPKGVQVTYKNLLNFFTVINKELPISEEDILLSLTTISFDISIMEMFLPLILGATLVIGTKRMLIDMNKLKNAIIENNITVLQATPITWNMLASSDWKNETDIKIFCGGEKLEEELANKLLSISSNVWNLYGPTETTIWSSVQKIESSANISIGKPLNNINYYIFDENMNIANEGELYIGGKCVSKGYMNNVLLTKERFIKNPLNCNEIIYKTGDVVKKIKGKFYYIGRNDFQIKLNGHRIELEEIENCIKSIDKVKDAVVVPNQNNKTIIAFVILKEPIINLKEYINNILSQTLPQYMIPRFIENIDNFPTTFNNKIDRKELLKNYNLKYKNKEDSKERLIKIWEKYLKCEVNGDTRFDDFILDSLDLIKLCAEMNQIGIDISLSQLFEYKTINKIFESIKGKKDENIENEFSKNKLYKKLEKYNIDIDRIKVTELNEIENTMFMYYLFNRDSDTFYESYNYEIDNKLDNEFIIDEFNKVFSNVESLKSLYFFNIDGKNVKIFSKGLKLIKSNIIRCTSKVEYDKVIEMKGKEIYSINKVSIEINIVEYKSKKNIIINYHHVRMDGNRFYEKMLVFFEKLYSNYKEIEKKSLNIPSNAFIIKNSNYLKKYCLEKNIRLGTLLQYLIVKVLVKRFGLRYYDIVINNILRRSDNDILIKRVGFCNNLKEQQKLIDESISSLSKFSDNKKEHDVLVIVNNRQDIYKKFKKYGITEQHIEKNNYKNVFLIDIQEEIQISLFSKLESLSVLEDIKKEVYNFMEEEIK